MIYSLLLEDRITGRGSDRQALDRLLARPADPEQAQKYDEAQWGLDQEAIAAAAAQDSLPGLPSA